MAEGQGRKVLVTGGARGAGAAIVSNLARSGYAVDFTYASSQVASGNLAKTLQDETGVPVTAFKCDFSDASAVDTLADDLSKGDGFYGLVHNAGATYDSLAAMVDQSAAERLMQVNFWAFTRLVKGLVRPMTRARSGRIIAIGSITAARGSTGNAIYAASKAALGGYLTTLSGEVAKRGVTANLIAPGFIDTDMLAPYAAVRDALEKQIPSGKFGTPEEVAGCVAFLLSDAAAYITGATLNVDGGLAAALATQR
jgi:NAD(P)-dependent dehydrogenase (short-subunit alcohol dehydrogenase family)